MSGSKFTSLAYRLEIHERLKLHELGIRHAKNAASLRSEIAMVGIQKQDALACKVRMLRRQPFLPGLRSGKSSFCTADRHSDHCASMAGSKNVSGSKYTSLAARRRFWVGRRWGTPQNPNQCWGGVSYTARRYFEQTAKRRL
jgi:hypothetical protein